MFSSRNADLIKWAVAVAVFGGLAAAGAVYWQRGVAVSRTARADTRVASTDSPVAKPQILVHEVVKEIRTKEEEPIAEEGDPAQAMERARELQAEIVAQRDAHMETGFQAAAAPDQAARETEVNLTAAFSEAGVRTSTVECRSSFCRIQASFADDVTADMALKQIFLSGQDERVPNLASTVSRVTDDDGTTHVKIYLHPDHLAYNPRKSTQ